MCVDGRNIGRGPSIDPVFTVKGFVFDPPLPLPLPALACESSPISTMRTPFGAENAVSPFPFDTSISLELFCFMIPGMFTLITNALAFTSRPVPRRNRRRSRRFVVGAYAPAGFPPAAAAAAAAARAARNRANRLVAPDHHEHHHFFSSVFRARARASRIIVASRAFRTVRARLQHFSIINGRRAVVHRLERHPPVSRRAPIARRV
jgi:hypothetical protein